MRSWTVCAVVDHSLKLIIASKCYSSCDHALYFHSINSFVTFLSIIESCSLVMAKEIYAIKMACGFKCTVLNSPASVLLVEMSVTLYL